MALCHITLECTDGRKCKYKCTTNDFDRPCSVLYDRAIIQFGLDRNSVILTYDGKALHKNNPMKTYGILDNAKIYCAALMWGGGGVPFADVEHPPEHGEFSPSAPDYRICVHGISIEGVCTNTYCSAYNKHVLYRFGYGEWDLLKNKAYCPMCKQSIVPETPYLCYCVYNITYTKSDNSAGHTGWKTVMDGFDTFTVEKYEKVEYESLKIVAKRSDMIVRAYEGQHKIVVRPSRCCLCDYDFAPTDDNVVVFECTHGAHKKCFDRLKKSLLMCPECESQIVVCHQPNQYRRYDCTCTSPFC